MQTIDELKTYITANGYVIKAEFIDEIFKKVEGKPERTVKKTCKYYHYMSSNDDSNRITSSKGQGTFEQDELKGYVLCATSMHNQKGAMNGENFYVYLTEPSEFKELEDGDKSYQEANGKTPAGRFEMDDIIHVKAWLKKDKKTKAPIGKYIPTSILNKMIRLKGAYGSYRGNVTLSAFDYDDNYDDPSEKFIEDMKLSIASVPLPPHATEEAPKYKPYVANIVMRGMGSAKQWIDGDAIDLEYPNMQIIGKDRTDDDTIYYLTHLTTHQESFPFGTEYPNSIDEEYREYLEDSKGEHDVDYFLQSHFEEEEVTVIYLLKSAKLQDSGKTHVYGDIITFFATPDEAVRHERQSQSTLPESFDGKKQEKPKKVEPAKVSNDLPSLTLDDFHTEADLLNLADPDRPYLSDGAIEDTVIVALDQIRDKWGVGMKLSINDALTVFSKLKYNSPLKADAGVINFLIYRGVLRKKDASTIEVIATELQEPRTLNIDLTQLGESESEIPVGTILSVDHEYKMFLDLFDPSNQVKNTKKQLLKRFKAEVNDSAEMDDIEDMLNEGMANADIYCPRSGFYLLLPKEADTVTSNPAKTILKEMVDEYGDIGAEQIYEIYLAEIDEGESPTINQTDAIKLINELIAENK